MKTVGLSTITETRDLFNSDILRRARPVQHERLSLNDNISISV